MILYICAGNSDDKLTQKDWADLCWNVGRAVAGVGRSGGTVHGEWYSLPDCRWQSACWCVEFDPDRLGVAAPGNKVSSVTWLRRRLAEIAKDYDQDSIAWGEVPNPEFIRPLS